jgi:hypothetical protein
MPRLNVGLSAIAPNKTRKNDLPKISAWVTLKSLAKSLLPLAAGNVCGGSMAMVAPVDLKAWCSTMRCTMDLHYEMYDGPARAAGALNVCRSAQTICGCANIRKQHTRTHARTHARTHTRACTRTHANTSMSKRGRPWAPRTYVRKRTRSSTAQRRYTPEKDWTHATLFQRASHARRRNG